MSKDTICNECGFVEPGHGHHCSKGILARMKSAENNVADHEKAIGALGLLVARSLRLPAEVLEGGDGLSENERSAIATLKRYGVKI